MHESNGLSQFAILAGGVCLVAIGGLGLTGTLTTTPVVAAVLLIIALVLAYLVGKKHAEIEASSIEPE